MATTYYGKIEEFQLENESISGYLERIELYFSANAVEEGKQVAVFLSMIGAKTYSLLRNLLAPTKPKEASLTGLTDALKNHF